MNRRAFLRALGLASAGFALDPERLLWVPGQRTFFLPPTKSVISLTDGTVLRVGDIFTIGGHYANGWSGPLQPFVVTGEVDGFPNVRLHIQERV